MLIFAIKNSLINQIPMNHGLVDSAQLKRCADNVIIVICIKIGCYYYLEIYKYLFDKDQANQPLKNFLKVKQFELYNHPVNQFKMTKNLQYCIFSQKKSKLVVFDLKFDETQKFQIQSENQIKSFKLIQSENSVALLISQNQNLSLIIEIRNFRAISELIQKCDLKFCSLASKFNFKRLEPIKKEGTIIQFIKINEVEQRIVIKKTFSQKGVSCQKYINAEYWFHYQWNFMSVNRCCDLFFSNLKLYCQTKQIRKYLVGNSTNASKINQHQFGISQSSYVGKITFSPIDIATAEIYSISKYGNEKISNKLYVLNISNSLILLFYQEEDLKVP